MAEFALTTTFVAFQFFLECKEVLEPMPLLPHPAFAEP